MVDFINRLRNSEQYKRALAMARTPEERARVEASAEAFVSAFSSVLGPLIEAAQADTNTAIEMGQALVGQTVVVNDVPHSGSVQ